MDSRSGGRQERQPLLIHMCSGGLAHMLKDLSNSLDYSIHSKRALMPFSVNHDAFGLPFYDVFEPVGEAGIFVSPERYNELTSRPIHHPTLGQIEIGKLDLRYKPSMIFPKGIAGKLRSYLKTVKNILSTNKESKQKYNLCVDGHRTHYLLLIDADDRSVAIQITTGEFLRSTRYGNSYSALHALSLTHTFSQYIRERSQIFNPRCIAVHYRNSADKSEPYKKLHKRISSAVKKGGHTELFVATDNSASLTQLAGDFPGLNVVSHTPLLDLSRIGRTNMHYVDEGVLERELGISKADQIGDALADLWCLSNAEVFIPSSGSGFSDLVAYFRNAPEVSRQFFSM